MSFYLLQNPESADYKHLNEKAVFLVDLLLYKAINMKASDIHLESTRSNLRVRFRIDGVLYEQDSIDLDNALSVISRIKILSSLDISEKRIPQDGKIRLKLDNILNDNFIDIRVSSFPSIYGEKIVLRILDRNQNMLNISSLGLDDDSLQELNFLIKSPHGFFLTTGPTGSGKTTTLYALISQLDKSELNIITMEDPVEYNIDGITQSHINEKAGFTFKKGLRSILRQDPDVILIGEIRDKESAQIAIESSLTGHMVLSTLHTNDSVGVITRLLDMGVESFLINASLSGVLAQRLARRLCNHCKVEYELSNDQKDFLKEKFGNFIDIKKLKKAYKARGCPNCFNLGYSGRIGIFELLKISDSIRDLVSAKASKIKIFEKAKKDGLKPMCVDGLNKAFNGVISIEELLRVL